MKNQIPVRKKATHKVAPLSGFPRQSVYTNHVFLAGILLLVTFCCYLPTLSASFIPTWDDNAYVVDNALIRNLSWESVKAMFSTQVGGTYVPLPLLSYAIEYQISGLNPIQFHLTNLLLHLICTLLVFSIIRMLKIKAVFAACAALIYGVHPMGVESVAWITERKDLLYSMFYFGSLLLYIYYVKSTKRKLLWFLASLGVFILALFSKIQAVSLPLVLLLVDYYFGRTKIINLFLEKIPYFLLSLVFGIAGIFVLKSVGALKINEMFTLTERVFFGLYSLSAYFLKFFAPVTMSALYPYPVTSGNTLPLVYYLSPLFIVATGFAIYLTAGKTKAVVFGGLFFLLSIVFMLQIFGAGQGFLADRYVKVPYLGLVFVVGWGLENFPSKFRYGKLFMWLFYTVVALVFMGLTYQRCLVWKNGETLWSDVIAKYPLRDSRPYACRGLFYRAEKDNVKALADLNVSLDLDPYDAEMMLMRGNVCFDLGKDVQAYSDYMKVLKIKMDNSLALGNLGAIFVRRGQFDSAVFYLTKSIQLDSSVAITFANRAVAFGGMGKAEESIADFKYYYSVNPDDERVCMSIALAYQKLGRYPESLEWFDRAITRKPGFGSYYYYRSQSYKFMGNKAKALADGLKARDLGVKIPIEYIQSLR
ncbi:MAG: tetratricopeptide repeat protein [Bacteroidales bacterium]